MCPHKSVLLKSGYNPTHYKMDFTDVAACKKSLKSIEVWAVYIPAYFQTY